MAKIMCICEAHINNAIKARFEPNVLKCLSITLPSPIQLVQLAMFS